MSCCDAMIDDSTWHRSSTTLAAVSSQDVSMARILAMAGHGGRSAPWAARRRPRFPAGAILDSGRVIDLRQNAAQRAVASGLALALIVYVVPLLRFVFHTLITLVHEHGHTISAWSFGIPAIPAFDFVYGGGVTL